MENVASNKKFLVYKSSAGSGKTYTLVKEYLKLALADENTTPTLYKSILAITFTNKAASEMKERVLKALSELSLDVSNPKNHDLVKVLCADLKIDPIILSNRAANVLTQILHNYSDFSISTIDSFVHRIIRSFAHDLELSVNFSIETDKEEVLQKSIANLLLQIGKSPELTEFLIDFSIKKTEDDKSWDVERDLHDIARNAINEVNEESVNVIKDISLLDFVSIKNDLQKKVRDFEKQVKNIGQRSLELIEKNNLTQDNFQGKSRGLVPFYRKLFSGVTQKSELLKDTVNKIIDSPDSIIHKDTKGIALEAAKRIEPELLKLLSEFKGLYSKDYPNYVLEKEVYNNIHALALVNEINRLILEFKEDNNVLFISEFNNLISEIVLEQPIPFIYERIGDKYKHFLIDEFQDTSQMQWQNLLPLVDNSLAELNKNLIVGDGKQSIYRFRGGDVEQFADLPKVKNPKNNENVAERERTLVNNYEYQNLGTNYRSKREVILFNNGLFEFIKQNHLKEKYIKVYEDLQQAYLPSNTGGFVDFTVKPKKDKKAEVFIDEDESEEEEDDFYCQATLDRIKFNLNLNFNYKDICVLVRNKKVGSDIADYLVKNNVPIVSSESLLISKNEEVNFIIAFLNQLIRPNDRVSLTILCNYLCGKGFINIDSKHDLLSSIGKEREAFIQNLFRKAGKEFKASDYTSLSIFDCCVKLIEEFSLSKESPLYIQFFLDEIFVFTKNNSNNIYSFLEWWENRKKSASIILPEGVDAVNIMTIHASKGLEFPVVIIPACDWKYKDNELLWIDINKDNNNKLKKALAKSNLEFIDEEHIALAEDEFEKQKLDSINILYVAFTRPVHHLHVIMKPPRRKESIYHLLMEHMNTHGKLLDNETYCSFGEALPNLNSQVLEDNKEVNELMITEWRDRIRIKQGSLLSYESDSESVRDKGIVVHYVLSKVNDYLSWEQALESCKLEGIFPEIEFEEYYALLENLFSNNDVKKYFEPNQNLKIEAEILCADGKVIRPDRIVISNSEVYLIDFKTGLPQKKYSKQLSTYSDALSELGYRNIKKVLIYLNPLLVEEF